MVRKRGHNALHLRVMHRIVRWGKRGTIQASDHFGRMALGSFVQMRRTDTIRGAEKHKILRILRKHTRQTPGRATIYAQNDPTLDATQRPD